MEILVIGEGCRDCNALFENTKRAVKTLGLSEDVKKVENLTEIVKLGVYEAPALMVDGKLLIAGRKAKEKEILKALKKML